MNDEKVFLENNERKEDEKCKGRMSVEKREHLIMGIAFLYLINLVVCLLLIWLVEEIKNSVKCCIAIFIELCCTTIGLVIFINFFK